MWKVLLVPTVLMAQASSKGPEFAVGVGPLFFAMGGADVEVTLQPAGSRWLYGFKHVQFTDKARDPFTGRELTETRQTLTGPTVTFVFRPGRGFSGMLGGSVLRWTKREESLMTGEVGRDSTTALFVGGGFTGTMGSHFYYRVGIYLAPGAQLKTHTSVSSEEDSGGIDAQLHLGFRF
ncbi:MAG TPA: hypothetical protein VJ570_13235 [Holophagaceae bacterium]|nr:hypothetical protein [Holophagaceae bacterium]